MSEPDGPATTTVNIRMTEDLLADIDEAWREEGFSSRSEFIRLVLRDATKHPTFNRADLKTMLRSEVAIQEGRTYDSDTIKREFGLGEYAEAEKE